MSIYIHFKPSAISWPFSLMTLYLTWLTYRKVNNTVYLDKNNITYCVLYVYDTNYTKLMQAPRWVKIYQVSKARYYHKLATITHPTLRYDIYTSQWLVDLISDQVEKRAQSSQTKITTPTNNH